MDDREFRIYASSQGGEPILTNIPGEQALNRCLQIAREWYPNDTLFVREVLETVVTVVKPDNDTIVFPSSQPGE